MRRRKRGTLRATPTEGVVQKMPALMPDRPNFAWSTATARSHMETSWQPAAAAAPCTRATTGCGSCVFGMEGVEDCVLAVRIDGKAYLVSGVEMPGHESGLCDHSRMASFDGKLDGDTFVARSFTLKP